MDIGIKVVAFDFGGVLAKVDGNRFIDSLVKHTTFPRENLERMIKNSELSAELETGKIDFDEYFKVLTQKCKLNIEYSTFVQYFRDVIIGPNPPVLRLMKQLSGKYLTALLSNTNKPHSEVIRGIVGAYSSEILLSHEIGCKKPSRVTYHSLFNRLRKYGLIMPDQVCFIDNDEANITAARGYGFQGIIYKGHEQLIEDLNNISVTL